MEEIKQKNNKNFVIDIIMSNADFERGIELFVNYKSVKVLRKLKTEFQKTLIDYFVSKDVMKWESTQTPLKLYWKFKRIKTKL